MCLFTHQVCLSVPQRLLLIRYSNQLFVLFIVFLLHVLCLDSHVFELNINIGFLIYVLLLGFPLDLPLNLLCLTLQLYVIFLQLFDLLLCIVVVCLQILKILWVHELLVLDFEPF